MLFHSLEFIFAFLPITFVGFLLARHFMGARASLVWLAGASIVFYAQWSLAHGLLLALSVTVNFLYCQAMLIADKKERWRQVIFYLSIASNLGLLGYLKYANFFIDNINYISGESLPYVQVLVPVGVSFYTFIQIGYLVEVYGRQITKVNFIEYFVFGSFFAYVTAGPLVLQRDMMPQFEDNHKSRIEVTAIAIAITIFCIGLFKKLVLADSIAPVADTVFNGVAGGAVPTMGLAWIGALAYTVQLYFDFSGYTDMAMGIGMLFKFRLPFNFNSPLKATSITEFWRRWHMTMTRFFTNYIYAPLAISNSRAAILGRYGAVRRFLSTVAIPVTFTFVLAGIWHGAGWTFVIFGCIHGLAMAVNHAWRQANMPELPDAIGWLATMSVVIVGLVMFRAADVETATTILYAMVSLQHLGQGWIEAAQAGVINESFAVGLITILFAVALMAPNTQQIMYRYNISSDPSDYEDLVLSRWLQWQPSPRWALACAVILALGLGMATSDSVFIYYQF